MKPITNLAGLSEEELETFLESFDHVFCDCDGVILTLDGKSNFINGVEDTIEKLRKCGKKVHIVTNNSSIGFPALHQKLNKSIIKFEEVDVISPTVPIIAYLRKIQFNKKLYVLGMPPMRNDFVKAGFTVAEFGVNTELTLNGLIQSKVDDPEIGAVIVDIDGNLTYEKLFKACVYLARKDVLFIAAATERIVTIPNSCKIIGPQFFQDIIEEVTEKKPLQFGKPSKNLGSYLVEKFNLKISSRSVFVGDAFATDMAFGQHCGFQTLLTLNGVTRKKDLENIQDKTLAPDYVVQSFGDINTFLKKFPKL